MKRPVHVLQLIDSMAFGGAEVLLRDLTCGLLERGYKVSVCYSTSGPIADEMKAIGVSITRLPRLGRLDPFLLWRMWHEIRRKRPDIVHTHLFKSDFHGRIAARLAGVKVVISTLHNCDPWAKNPILGNIYGLTARLADKIIAVSQDVQEYAIRYRLSQPDYVETIPNAIPLERFKKDKLLGCAIRKEFNISENAPLLGIIARLSEQKDHQTFLKAAAIIAEKRPATRFLIVGEGPLRPYLQELTESMGLSRSVIFCGIRKDIESIYSALDVLVFSSRWEGLPVSLLEGMASGLPIVATDVGSISRVMKAGEMGAIVAPGDPVALAEACLALIDDPELRQKMGEAALTLVESSYSLQAMVDKISNLYQSFLPGVGV